MDKYTHSRSLFAGILAALRTVPDLYITVVFKTDSLEIKKFWLKIDDYGNEYVGTFLFPEDY